MIKGVTAAPDVIVMGPDRRAIRTKGPGFVEPGWIVYKDARLKTTHVDAVAAPGGKWDFVSVPRSSRIAGIQTAAGITIPSARAGIQSAKRHRYVVAYRVFGRPSGDTITVEEADGTRVPVSVATLRGTRGAVTWTPSPKLSGGTRVLIAVITRGTTNVSVQALTALNLKPIAKPKPKKPKPKKPKPKRPSSGDGSPSDPQAVDRSQRA